MDTEQLEKQLQTWNRFLYVVLGSSVTLVLIIFGTIFDGREWPGFDNYVGGIWSWIQLLATPPGFYLLWGRRWKSIPLSNRINTIIGYFAASWINLLSLRFLAETAPATDYYFLLVDSAIVIILGYIWALKRTSLPREEMFP